VAAGGFAFDFMLQKAQPGARIDSAVTPLPDDHRKVSLGRLSAAPHGISLSRRLVEGARQQGAKRALGLWRGCTSARPLHALAGVLVLQWRHNGYGQDQETP